MTPSLIVIAIIMVTLGMIAYPLLQLMPNERQKQQQLLRQEAIKQGLFVQIRTPDIDERLKETYQHLNSTVAYFLPKPTQLPSTYCAIRSINHEGRWLWAHQKQPEGQILDALQPFLNKLPTTYKAIEIGHAGVAIFWPETVKDNIHHEIKQIRRLLLSIPL